MIKLKRIIVLIWMVLGVCFAQTNKKTVVRKNDYKFKSTVNSFIIKGSVTQTMPYCGGAEPSEGVLEEAATPKPYNGKIFFLRKGKVNSKNEPVVLSFTVNASGTFSFQLPAGVYSFFQEPQLKQFNKKDYPISSYTQEEIDCLKKWWVQPYYTLEIKDKDINNLNFEFHHQCFALNDIPCLQYNGPMPP